MLPRRYAKISLFTLVLYSIWFLYVSYEDLLDDRLTRINTVVSNAVLWSALVVYAVFMSFHTTGIWVSYSGYAKPDESNVQGARRVLFLQWMATFTIGVWSILFSERQFYAASVVIAGAHVFLLWGFTATASHTTAPTACFRYLPGILWVVAWGAAVVPALVSIDQLRNR